jgi:hypothetical protein
MRIKFKNVEVGERFYDPNTAEDYSKVCGNAAEFLTGGNHHSGQLATFEEDEFVEITGEQTA